VNSIKRGVDETRRPRRTGYVLALAWIVIGSVLYAVELLRLAVG